MDRTHSIQLTGSDAVWKDALRQSAVPNMKTTVPVRVDVRQAAGDAPSTGHVEVLRVEPRSIWQIALGVFSSLRQSGHDGTIEIVSGGQEEEPPLRIRLELPGEPDVASLYELLRYALRRVVAEAPFVPEAEAALMSEVDPSSETAEETNAEVDSTGPLEDRMPASPPEPASVTLIAETAPEGFPVREKDHADAPVDLFAAKVPGEDAGASPPSKDAEFPSIAQPADVEMVSDRPSAEPEEETRGASEETGWPQEPLAGEDGMAAPDVTETREPAESGWPGGAAWEEETPPTRVGGEASESASDLWAPKGLDASEKARPPQEPLAGEDGMAAPDVTEAREPAESGWPGGAAWEEETPSTQGGGEAPDLATDIWKPKGLDASERAGWSQEPLPGEGGARVPDAPDIWEPTESGWPNGGVWQAKAPSVQGSSAAPDQAPDVWTSTESDWPDRAPSLDAVPPSAAPDIWTSPQNDSQGGAGADGPEVPPPWPTPDFWPVSAWLQDGGRRNIDLGSDDFETARRVPPAHVVASAESKSNWRRQAPPKTEPIVGPSKITSVLGETGPIQGPLTERRTPVEAGAGRSGETELEAELSEQPVTGAIDVEPATSELPALDEGSSALDEVRQEDSSWSSGPWGPPVGPLTVGPFPRPRPGAVLPGPPLLPGVSGRPRAFNGSVTSKGVIPSSGPRIGPAVLGVSPRSSTVAIRPSRIQGGRAPGLLSNSPPAGAVIGWRFASGSHLAARAIFQSHG